MLLLKNGDKGLAVTSFNEALKLNIESDLIRMLFGGPHDQRFQQVISAYDKTIVELKKEKIKYDKLN